MLLVFLLQVSFPEETDQILIQQLPGQIAQGADDFKSRKGKLLMQSRFFAKDILVTSVLSWQPRFVQW